MAEKGACYAKILTRVEGWQKRGHEMVDHERAESEQEDNRILTKY
jgi:hypothetical protein